MTRIIVSLVEEEISELRDKKKFRNYFIKMIIFTIVLFFYLSMTIRRYGINIQVTNLGIYLFGSFYSLTFFYSKLIYSDKSKLAIMLPISKINVFLSYRIIIFIKAFLKTALPIYIAVLLNMLLYGDLGVLSFLLFFIQFILIYDISVSVSFLFIFELLSNKIILCYATAFLSIGIGILIANGWYPIVIPGICILTYICSLRVFKKYYKYYQKNVIRNVGRKKSLLFREFCKFFSDKILVINHIGICIFSILFIINLIRDKSSMYFLMSIMLFIPLLSTSTSCLFSYESEKIDLIHSLPIKASRFLLNEYIVIVAVTLPCYGITLSLLKYFDFVDVVYIILIASIILILCIYKIILDVHNPITAFEHTKQLLEDRRKYKVWMKMLVAYLPIFLYPLVHFAIIILAECILVFVLIKREIMNKRRSIA